MKNKRNDSLENEGIDIAYAHTSGNKISVISGEIQNQMLTICDDCKCITEELYTVEVNGVTKRVCIDCLNELGFTLCDACGAVVSHNRMRQIYKWSWTMWMFETIFVCDDCYHKHSHVCEHCGITYFNARRFRWFPFQANSLCEYCEYEQASENEMRDLCGYED